jgi:hypothetical protein
MQKEILLYNLQINAQMGCVNEINTSCKLNDLMRHFNFLLRP